MSAAWDWLRCAYHLADAAGSSKSSRFAPREVPLGGGAGPETPPDCALRESKAVSPDHHSVLSTKRRPGNIVVAQ